MCPSCWGEAWVRKTLRRPLPGSPPPGSIRRLVPAALTTSVGRISARSGDLSRSPAHSADGPTDGLERPTSATRALRQEVSGPCNPQESSRVTHLLETLARWKPSLARSLTAHQTKLKADQTKLV